MAYSYTQLPGDGSNQNFTFTFDYLSKAHISAYVDGVAVSFNWITDFSVQIIPAPAAGTIVEVRRVTPLDEPIVDWSDGSVITESDLDLNTLFSLYAAQEVEDAVEAALGFDALGVWNGQGRTTSNFADAVSPTGLITKQQLENSYKPDIDASVAAAAASATASANSATQSQLSATQSANSASDAAAILALFKGQYLGAQPTNPTVDGNGNPLTEGDLYFNTTVDEMRVFNGTGWIPVGSTVEGTLKRPPGYTPIIATAGQTSVPVVGGYDPYNIIVLVNGTAITSPDVNVSSGTNLVFTASLSAGDEVDYYAFGLLSIANTFTKAELLGAGGATNIGITPAGNITTSNVQAALNELDAKKARLAGSASQVFSVADATLGSHAINLTQADSRYLKPALTARQTVLSGPVNSQGAPNFGGATGSTTVTATGTLIATAANGFNAQGPVDLVGSITNPSWTGLSSNGTMFLYLDIAANGTCTPVSSGLGPVYKPGGTPAVTNGQFTFDYTKMVGMLGSGAAAAQRYRVCVGQVTVASGVVSAIVWYALNGFYESDETAIPALALNLSHNIGTTPLVERAILLNVVAENGYVPGDHVDLGRTQSGGTDWYTPISTSVGVNSFSLCISSTLCTLHKTTATRVTAAPANWRIKTFLRRGW